MEVRRTCTRGQKMLFPKQIFAFTILWFLLFLEPHSFASNEYIFVVREAPYRRLCEKKKILTVNGQYPGPTLRVQKGDAVFVNVKNRGKSNITIHWHGVEQPRNPWSDGPAYITQCPIQPGKSFRQKVIFSREEGTLWWHAHSTWARATVHGAIIIYPKFGTSYPFRPPYAEVPIILGEWWKKDITDVYKEFIHSGGDPNVSDAFTINGQPGDLYPCSQSGTFKLSVDQGKTYLLRMVNAAMNTILFFSVAKHKLTVVGIDGSYTKALTKEFVMISPGQTMDALLEANQEPNQYYMAARAYSTGFNVAFDNTTTTAIVLYTGHYTPPSSPSMPYLPNYTDSTAAFSFLGSLKSLANEEHPVDVPLDIQTRMILTLSVNAFPCPHGNAPSSCQGPNVTRLAASMNNISFITPSTDILRAYYKHINGVFDAQFPNLPPLVFDFTAPYMPLIFEIPNTGTEVKLLEYNTTVEIVFQGTNLVAGIDHPIHLHGYSFYIIGFGFGNFDEEKDPLNYNLVDPPLRNTMTVPINGWSTIRFKTNNPGVWFMHCHIERHLTWGMETVFIVKNGRGKDAKLLPPPTGMPPC